MFRNLALSALATLALATPALCDTITNIDFTPDSPADLLFGDDVVFTFDYDVSEDARIFGRPFFEGALRTDYSAHGSPLYSMGTGSGTGFFRIHDAGLGIAHVDEVRFQILSSDQTILLHEIFVPVDFTFGAVTPVPEPGYFALLCTGLLGLTGVRRKLRRHAAR